MPFLNSTVEEVYEFFKNHLRPKDDDPQGCFHTFSYFSFLAVDADCVKSKPYQCILCCDAPDVGEAHPETRLKQHRLRAPHAVEGLFLLEELVQMPSEFVSNPDFVLGVMPPCWTVPVLDENGERTGGHTIATPGRARNKKSHSVWNGERGLR